MKSCEKHTQLLRGLSISGNCFLLILFVLFLFMVLPAWGGIDKESIKPKLTKITIPFIENQGQIKDTSVKFYANTFAGTVFVTEKGEIVYSLQSKAVNQKPAFTSETKQSQKARFLADARDDKYKQTKGWIIKENVLGFRGSSIHGRDKAGTKVNYFIGNQKENWRNSISSYDSITFGEIYDGIELELKAYGNNVEKLFIVKPGADVSKIKMSLEGTKSLRINEKGELEIETGLGILKFTKPYAYQEIAGEKVEVAASFNLRNSELRDPNSELFYGFEVASYDKNYPLIIDPLLYSTFIGGNGSDAAYAIAVDSAGNAYITGTIAFSTSGFPTTPGAYDTTPKEIFITKLNSAGSALVYSTFLGGSGGQGEDKACGIAVDTSGNVYVTGYTLSSDFPTTPGAYDTTHNGVQDVFVTKLNPDGNALIYSTFIGTSASDFVYAIVLDSSGNVYLPINNNANIYITKLNSSGNAIIYSFFLGGSSNDSASSIAVDNLGSAYITGFTYSSDFPTTPGAYDTSYNGSESMFVTKLNPQGNALVYSTFLGSVRYYSSIAVDSSGNAYVTGYTMSPGFPTTPGAYDTSFNGIGDIFVTKLNATGSALVYATFLGGSLEDYHYLGHYIVIDNSGNVYVTGTTFSSDFPTTPGAYDTSYNGGADVFVTKLNATGSALVYSTFLGGNWGSQAYAIAKDNSGNIYITGTTESNFPTTPGAYDTSHNGDWDVFVAKFTNNLSAVGLIDLPKTGQTTSYYPGDDGDIQAGVAWPSPRFTDNGDGTVTDNFTGLMWTKDANLMVNRDPGFDIFGEVDGAVPWQAALGYVAKLNQETYLGYTDWRLPNIIELESLTDSEQLNPALPFGNPFIIWPCTPYNTTYWSSTSGSGFNSGGAYALDICGGEVNPVGKTGWLYVWPVRSENLGLVSLQKTGQTTCYDTDGNVISCSGTGQDGELQKGVEWPSPRFTDNGNETVTDNLTGLMWTKNANLPNGTRTWQQALDYIAGMNAGAYTNYGYSDWRLPNKKELLSLIDFGQIDPALPSGNTFINVPPTPFYWASTNRNENANVISIWYGGLFYNSKSGINYVWPVRGGIVTKPIDTAPPTTTALPTSGTYASAQNVTLTCYDGSGSGCKSTYYCLGSGCNPTNVYSGSIAISSSNTLRFYSTDNAGNSESVKTETYTITSGDTTPPVTTLSSNPSSPNGQNGWFVTTPSISLSRNEPGNTYYQWDSTTGVWQIYSVPFNAPEGEHTLYYYSVDTATNTENTKSQLFKTDITPPSVPTNLAANAPSSTRVNLTWNACTDNIAVSGYNIYNADTNAFLVKTANTSYNFTGLTPNTTYRYYVKAFDLAGNLSGASNTAPVTTPPLQSPTDLTATPKSAYRIDLTWKAPTPKTGLLGYKIERSPDGLANWQVIQDVPSIDTTSYSDAGLISSTTYYYRVRSYDSTGNTSDPSNVANATTYKLASVLPGTDVLVDLGNGVSLIFKNVVASGTALVEVPDSPPQLGFSVSKSFYFDITTKNVTYSGPILVALPYDEIPKPTLMHYEYDSKSGKWKYIDVTIDIDPLLGYDPDFPQVTVNPDTVNKIIYGKVTSLSPFVIVEPIVTCSFTTDGTTLIRGGTLRFWASAHNDTDDSQTFQFATFVTLPNGHRYPTSGWLLGPITVPNLAPHTSKSKYLTQFIPNNALYGTYTYHGYVGVVGPPPLLYNECQFNFTVVQ